MSGFIKSTLLGLGQDYLEDQYKSSQNSISSQPGIRFMKRIKMVKSTAADCHIIALRMKVKRGKRSKTKPGCMTNHCADAVAGQTL